MDNTGALKLEDVSDISADITNVGKCVPIISRLINTITSLLMFFLDFTSSLITQWLHLRGDQMSQHNESWPLSSN